MPLLVVVVGVGNGEDDRRGADGDIDADGGVRYGMLERVGEGFLQDAVQGELPAGREAAYVTGCGVGDLRSGCPDAFEQLGYGAQARLRAEFDAVGWLAEDAEGAPEFVQRVPGRAGDEVQHLG